MFRLKFKGLVFQFLSTIGKSRGAHIQRSETNPPSFLLIDGEGHFMVQEAVSRALCIVSSRLPQWHVREQWWLIDLLDFGNALLPVLAVSASFRADKP